MDSAIIVKNTGIFSVPKETATFAKLTTQELLKIKITTVSIVPVVGM